MTLSDLASIGSFVSGIAVVFSFVFLALQMRQSARNQRAAIHNERTALVQELVLLAAAPERVGLNLRGGSCDLSLSDEDTMTYLSQTMCTIRLFEEFYLQHSDGMLDDARWENNVLRVRGFFHQPGFRAAWRATSAGYSPSFVQWMDGLYREIRAPAAAQPLPAVWRSLAKQELDEAVAG